MKRHSLHPWKLASAAVFMTLILCFDLANASAQGKKWALLVGVSKYDNADVPELKYTVKDVNAIRQALMKEALFDDDNVITMTNEARGESRATDTNVLRKLDFLANRIAPEDTFIFYFSGHGFQKDGKHFLATVNSDIKDLESLQRSSLSVDDLKSRLSRIRARQCAFLFDACRNSPGGGAGGPERTVSAALSRDLKRVASSATVPVVFLMSCKEGQRSYEYEEMEQGAFTFYLLEGLSGKAVEPSGDVTINALGAYVQEQMKAWSAKNLRGESQTPDFLQFGGASRIVLAKKGSSLVGLGPIPAGMARIVFKSTPPGAKIYLRGTDTNKTTPAVIDFPVTRSSNTVMRLILPGYAAYNLRAKIDPNSVYTVDRELEKLNVSMAPVRLLEVKGPLAPRPKQPSNLDTKPEIPTTDKVNSTDSAAMVLIPEGTFIAGGNLTGNQRRTEKTGSFYIYKYPVTVLMYKHYCKATGTKMPEPPTWGWQDDHPMVLVTWQEAMNYARWAGGTLPTQLEFEKAARGLQGRIYPWGNEFDADKVLQSIEEKRSGTGSVFRTTNVNQSPFGCIDMVGNVWHWMFDPPFQSTSQLVRTLRGTSFKGTGAIGFRAFMANRSTRDARHVDAGFRVAIPAP